MVNLWEDLETGPNPPEEIYAVVECLKGERNKVRVRQGRSGRRPRSGPAQQRPLSERLWVHPAVPLRRRGPFDVLVLVEDATFPGCVIEARPVALMKMDDDGEQDDKVIAVPSEDPRYDHIQDLDDIPQQELDEIDEFFSTYKNLEEGKEVETLGWEDKQAAYDAIEHAQDLYDENFCSDGPNCSAICVSIYLFSRDADKEYRRRPSIRDTRPRDTTES